MENEDNNSNGEAVPPKEDTQPDHLSGSHDGSLAIENLRCQENKAKTLSCVIFNFCLTRCCCRRGRGR